MTPYDWAAIAGALAWLPQRAGWVHRRFNKPKVRLTPGPTPEIGFSSLGPVFNFALRALKDS
jgi:hypothetical protein